MFCDADAPTPGRRWMQRAATAGLEELIAMPNAPVPGQRAVSENVMMSPSGRR